jgi:aminoglycoside 3-N-acetyltransferase
MFSFVLISVNTIVDSLNEAGVQRGATVCVHSFVGTFGMFSNGLQTIYDGFREALGDEGTLIVPTFNYDFCKGVPYGHENSPSQVGQFSEFCRRHPEGKRSLHPVYSHVVFGADRERYLKDPSEEAFGRDSLFARMHDQNALIVGFGVSFNSFTFFHYIESQVRVPYRFMKKFTGEVIVNGKKTLYSAPIYSRYLELDPRAEFGLMNLQTKLSTQGKVRKSILGRGEIISIRAQDLYNSAVAEVKKNPMCFLKNPVDLSQIKKTEIQ